MNSQGITPDTCDALFFVSIYRLTSYELATNVKFFLLTVTSLIKMSYHKLLAKLFQQLKINLL